MIKFDIPWYRYALIAELAQRLETVKIQFGKTKLQKMIYFLQVIYGVDCGYDFELYSYGPFTSQLLGDLDQVEHFGCITVISNQWGYYDILPTNKASALRLKDEEFLSNQRTKAALDSLVETYGAMTAKDLELRATIVYVERDVRRKGNPANKTNVSRLVGQIKPKFSILEIDQAVEELNNRGHTNMIDRPS